MFTHTEIERIIEAYIYEQNSLQTDDPKYFACINYFATFNLTSLGPKELEVIRDFLFKWGHMGRTGIDPTDPELGLIIKKHSEFLESARKQELHKSSILPDKQTIAIIFENLNSLVGPISASKILHLISPGFFQLWDNGVIDGCNSSKQFKYKSDLIEMVEKENTKGSHRPSGNGYYSFMEFTQSFINKYINVLTQIQTVLNSQAQCAGSKTLVKMADEFNMFATKKPFLYLL